MMTIEMNATVLRPAVPSRFRRGPARASVETLLDRIAGLSTERQRLRERSAAPTRIEKNRVKLARAQWELSHALIERYLPGAAHSHAA